jgi:transposase
MSPQRRHELTDEQWEQVAPLLPPQRPRTGRPAKDHRIVLNGILWILRTGAPWRDLPDRYGPWQTIYSRFRRWQEAGVWDQILTALQTEAAHDGTLDDSLAIIDGTTIRAHPQAVGKTRQKGDSPNRGSATAGVAGGASCI